MLKAKWKIFTNLIPLKKEILIHKKVFHFQPASESASIYIPAWSAVVRIIHGYSVVYKHFSLNESLQNMGALTITHKFNDTDENKLKQKLWATLKTTVNSRMLSHQTLY